MPDYDSSSEFLFVISTIKILFSAIVPMLKSLLIAFLNCAFMVDFFGLVEY